jgi:hypothetical protein
MTEFPRAVRARGKGLRCKQASEQASKQASKQGMDVGGGGGGGGGGVGALLLRPLIGLGSLLPWLESSEGLSILSVELECRRRVFLTRPGSEISRSES